MGTTEIIIVFSALMALIAFVTIGIDWIGKPLKHRRFIPRMYRFDDEKLPVDLYGNPTLGPVPGSPLLFPPSSPADAPSHLGLAHPEPAHVPPAGYSQPAPVVVARVDDLDSQSDQLVPAAPAASANSAAFSHNLGLPDQATNGIAGDLTSSWLADSPSETLAAASPRAERATFTDGGQPVSAAAWVPSMPLDATVLDVKPSLAAKAERFWTATSSALEASHFSEENLNTDGGRQGASSQQPAIGTNRGNAADGAPAGIGPRRGSNALAWRFD